MTDAAITEAVAAELFGEFVTPEARVDPYPVYERIRAASPVLDTGVGLWLVTGYDEVREILRTPSLSSDESKSAFNQENPPPPVGERPMHPSDDLDLMLFMDAPDHTRLRKLVSRSFTPRRIADVRPRTEQIVRDALDSVEPGAPFDVIGDFAFPIATQVICELLGVPIADRAHFGAWSSGMAKAIDPSAIRTEADDREIGAATESFVEYFSALIARRRKDAGNDLLSALIAVEEHGDRLSGDELLAMALLLLIAGHETTVNLIGNAVAAMIDDPEALRAFRSRRGDDRRAVDEFLRFDAPVQISQRIAVEEMPLLGRTIPSGTSLVLVLGAANRDPAVFDDAASLRFDRPDIDHVSFGGGVHHCLGAALARVEGEVAIRALIDRSPELELIEPPTRRSTFTLRGYDRLVVSRGNGAR